MPTRTVPTCSLVCLALALSSATPQAQGRHRDWGDLEPKPHSTLHVVDVDNHEVTGTFLSIDATALTLMVDAREQRFDAARVRRVARPGDSVRNGLVRGALVGIGLGLMADCFQRDRPCGAVRRTGAVALSASFMGVVGVGIDALRRGRTTLYEAPSAGTRPGPDALNSPGAPAAGRPERTTEGSVPRGAQARH